jgi:hypothetical protein
MTDLCKSAYIKKIFGEPNKGIHSYRIFNIAYMDVVATILGSILLARLMKWNYLYTMTGMFLLGIVLHRLFCVRTTVDKLLFPNAK